MTGFLYYRHMAPLPPRLRVNFCPIELKSQDYMHVLYFWKALDARMSEIMYRRYIGNISVLVTDIYTIYWLENAIYRVRILAIKHDILTMFVARGSNRYIAYRGRKTPSACRHCRPESFCASGKFLRISTQLTLKSSQKIA